jgi:hypothetical protein
VIPKADPQAPPPLPGSAEPPPLPEPRPGAIPVTPCPSCGGRMTVAPDHVNLPVQCPHCQAVFKATLPEGPAPGPAKRPRPPVVDDAREPRPRSEPGQKPDKVTVIGGMMLGGGIMALVTALGVGGFSGGMCCLWPGTWYAVVVGIMLIVRGANILGAVPGPSPHGLAIAQIVLIVNFDVINLVLGILAKVFLNEPEVKRYYGERVPSP